MADDSNFYLAEDPVSGFRVERKNLRRRWDGAWVRDRDLDPKPDELDRRHRKVRRRLLVVRPQIEGDLPAPPGPFAGQLAEAQMGILDTYVNVPVLLSVTDVPTTRELEVVFHEGPFTNIAGRHLRHIPTGGPGIFYGAYRAHRLPTGQHTQGIVKVHVLQEPTEQEWAERLAIHRLWDDGFGWGSFATSNPTLFVDDVEIAQFWDDAPGTNIWIDN